MPSLYVVGAQCTGRATLIEALIAELILSQLEHEVDVIQETAREVLQQHSLS